MTEPNQSMSLREIIKRFLRRESVPTFREGVYEDRYVDLEKLAKADITEKMEYVEMLRKELKGFNDRAEARTKKAAADKEAAEKAEFERRVAEAIKQQTPTPVQGGTPA